MEDLLLQMTEFMEVLFSMDMESIPNALGTAYEELMLNVVNTLPNGDFKNIFGGVITSIGGVMLIGLTMLFD